MSKYYGTIVTDKGTSTRAGHRWVKACAQTHDGSVIVEIQDDCVLIGLASGSSTGSHVPFFNGKLSEMLANPPQFIQLPPVPVPPPPDKRCPECKGSGEAAPTVPCPKCGGSGEAK
jgi:hypothetical protein